MPGGDASPYPQWDPPSQQDEEGVPSLHQGLCPHVSPPRLGLALVASPARPCPSVLRHAAGRCHPQHGWHGGARRWHGRAGMATLVLAQPRGERRPGHGLKGFGTGWPEQSRGWSRPGWQPPAAGPCQASCPSPRVLPARLGLGAATGAGGNGGSWDNTPGVSIPPSTPRVGTPLDVPVWGGLRTWSPVPGSACPGRG